MKLSLARILLSLAFILSYLYLVSIKFGVVTGNAEPVLVVKLTLYLAKGFATLCSVYLVFLTSSYIFKNENKVLKYLTDRSYTVYLLHLPICWIIGYSLDTLNLNVGIKYIVTVFAVYIITLLMHNVLMKMIKPKATKLVGNAISP